MSKSNVSYLASQGFHLVRLRPGCKQPAGGKGWLQRVATKTPRWKGRYNIGVMGGSPVRPGWKLLILDIDARNGGHGDLERLQYAFGPLPQTAAVYTPSGGRHLYFLVPDHHCAEYAALHSLGFRGIDIIKEDRYAVAPPSMVDGTAYEWISFPHEGVAEAPEWLLRLTRPLPKPEKAPRKASKTADGPSPSPSPESAREAKGKPRRPSQKAGEQWDPEELFEYVRDRFEPGPGRRNENMHKAVCSLVCRVLPEGEAPQPLLDLVEGVMSKWCEYYDSVYNTELDESLRLMRACLKSAAKKRKDGKLAPATTEDHEEAIRTWTLEEKQLEALEEATGARVVPSINRGDNEQTGEQGKAKKGQVKGRPLSASSRQEGFLQQWLFVEALLVLSSYRLSRGDTLDGVKLTDRQILDTIRGRHGYELTLRQIKYLRKKYVTAVIGEAVYTAGTLELMRRTKSGSSGIFPSVYELTGLRAAFDAEDHRKSGLCRA